MAIPLLPGPKKKGGLRFALKAAVAIVLLGLLAFGLTVVGGLYFTLRPQKTATTATPKDFGLAFEDVTLTTDDGVRIAGWYVPAKRGSGSGIVVLHDYPASKADLLAHTVFLAQEHSLLYIDLRYFGASGGRYATLGAKETKDVFAAIDELRRRGMGRIGIFGFSMGGSVALLAAARRPGDIAAVVAEAPYADMRVLVEHQFAYTGPMRGPAVGAALAIARGRYGVDLSRTPAAAAATLRLPVLLIHSRADEIVPYAQAEALRAALADDPAAEYLIMDDVPHGVPAPEFGTAVRLFFLKHLSPERAG